MDAAAYLTNQGWRGDGHSLHHSGRGITKPIHISQKGNVLGVGKKQHDAHADQWWARAFDDTLKGLNTTSNKATGKTEGVSLGSGAQALQMVGIGGAKWVGQGGLYNNFVRGESLSGTLTPEEKDHQETHSQSENLKKRKRGSNDVGLTAAAVERMRSKRKQRQQNRNLATYSKRIGVCEDPKAVALEEEHQKPREKLDIPENEEQRRQRRRDKKAKRALEVVESRELREQPLAAASDEDITSNRPKRRSKEQLHTLEDEEPVATKPCNPSPDGKRKSKTRKHR